MTDLIETACHNAVQAMHRESTRAHHEQRSPEACLILAAALDALLREGISGRDLILCVDHLNRQASPRMVA
jgi:hypothetical protein